MLEEPRIISIAIISLVDVNGTTYEGKRVLSITMARGSRLLNPASRNKVEHDRG